MPIRIILATLFLGLARISMANTSLLYIASQNPQDMGIFAAEFDPQSGRLSAPKLVAATRDPSHFTLSADGKRLYTCNSGTPGGVSAFAIDDASSGALRLLNHKESKGRGPSYVSLDNTGRYVLNANYGGGYVEVYSTTSDGSLDHQTAFVQHAGSSVHPQRQNKPYAHWIRTDPTNKFALVADLGTDHIVVYRFDAATGRLAAHEPPGLKVHGGSGPRHLAFHPNGRWVYAAQELGNEVIAFRWDAKRGELSQFQVLGTLPPDFAGANTVAEIAVRHDGRFLYVSNRGDDSIVVYAIDENSGELTLRQRVSSRGKVPRYFTFDPSHQWLIVTNQESGNVVVFGVDAKSGELIPKGEPVALPRPMGVVFLR